MIFAVSLDALRHRWHNYWFRPAPVFDLAVCRVIIVGCQMSLTGLPATYDFPSLFRKLDSLPEFMYEPLPVIQILTWPIGSSHPPPLGILLAIVLITWVAGVMAFVGWKTYASLLVFAASGIYTQGFARSWLRHD